MKRAKRFLSFLAILVILITMSLHVFADTYANHIAGARTGVVRILSGAYDSIYYAYGSGFAVGIAGESTDIFATNYHVVEDSDYCYLLLDNEWRRSVPEFGGVADGVHAVACEVIYENTYGPDYAILRAERIVIERVANPIMYSHLAYPADTVYTLGYPGSSDEVTGEDEAAVDAMTVTKGTISRFTYYEVEKSNVIQIDSVINHGNSGGPLVTEQGYVIGLNTWGVPDPSTDQIVYLALEVDYVIEKLNELIADGTLAGFTYTLIDQRPEDDAPSAPVPPTEAVQPTEAEQPTENLYPSETTPVHTVTDSTGSIVETSPEIKEEPSGNLLYIAIGVGVLGIIVILALTLNKRNTPKTQVSASSAQGAQATVYVPDVTPQFTLTCISGAFSGKSMPISKSLTFGRAQNCEILFAECTANVSRAHCQIIPSPNGLQLMDLGSTAGTFLANGTKLAPRQMYALKHGDIFYVGSSAQAFRIDQIGAPAVNKTMPLNASYSIVGIDGAFAGRKMTLSKEMTFGRNPACDVAFPSNTSGVSSRHFVLKPRGDGVIIMDLGSTYGTFLENGTKLTPNQEVRIRRGDCFSVGGKHHRFRVE